MPCFAALDVSQETTVICVVDDAGTIIVEKTVVTCMEMITSFLTDAAPDLLRVGKINICRKGLALRLNSRQPAFGTRSYSAEHEA